MTSRGPGRASRTPEMEEKELLRQQIRLLQGLIDDYKSLHGSAPTPGTSAACRWQAPAYGGGRAFSTRYPRPGRRGFSVSHGPAWRRKYSLVNRPPGPSEPPGDGAGQPGPGAGGSQAPGPQQHVLERRVQLSPDQSMVIRIKPSSKPGSASVAGAPRGSPQEREGPPWRDCRPQEGEGEPPGGQPPSRPGRAKGACSSEDPLLVCQKEPGKPRVVRSVSIVADSASQPRRTVSESAFSLQARSALPLRSGAASCVAQLLGDVRMDASHPDQPVPSGSVAGPARTASGPRQAREASPLSSCRTNKFRKNNYKWVAASAKSPRAPRRGLSPRAAAETVCTAPSGTAERVEKPQPRADPDAKPRKLTVSSIATTSPSKYKWKASSSSASSLSSFHWHSETGSKDRAPQLSPVPPRSPPRVKPAVGPSSLKPCFAETPLSAYKVKSRTKIIRRRASTGLPGDKKSSPPAAATAKSQFSLRRRQALRGKSGPAVRKTPSKGLPQVPRHRLCCQPPSRVPLPTKEASSVHTPRTPPASRVIKTRYRIVKKSPVCPLSTAPAPLPSWRTRRPSLSRSLVLNRLRPASASGRAPPGSPRWRNRGFRCIGGVLYRVSANKLSKTSVRPGDGGSRPLLHSGRVDPAGSFSRSLASRALQRSLALVRQARQRRRRKEPEFCMYYNRFGRCNRGERCPYVHDPEKVAVCTRFLRGSCKKTDGTCPFSHKVSKEKMPVCSYFLKGVCSNSSCPYSHVYVSRKAEVCADFLKGYCPLGAKCKRKHTLLCPDFSRRGVCPRAAQCPLLHRARKRLGRRAATAPAPEPSDAPPRSRASAGHGPRKSPAAQRPTRQTPSSPAATGAAGPAPPAPRPRLLAAAPASPPPPSLSLDPEQLSLREEATSVAMGSSSLSRLPAFISLQSSPSPGGPPTARTPRSRPCKDAGKPLHIKPRL